MKFIYLILVIFLELIIGMKFANAANYKEYFTDRDIYISKYQTYAAQSEDDRNRDESYKSLEVALEKTLQELIGSVQILDAKGKGNLLILDEYGFETLNGLQFISDKKILFVTTQLILDDYLNKEKLSKNFDNLAKTNLFYSGIFNSEAAFNYFLEFDLRKNNSINAHAMLMAQGQDTGPFPPDSLVILAKKGERIIAVYIDVKDKISQIQICKKQWKNSQPEGENFKAYTKCFAQNIKSQKSYSSLVTLAQSIVDEIAK
jgi:hypothetical protein